MENSYIHNSFIFIGNTLHARKYSTNMHFSPFLVADYPTPSHLDTSFQQVHSDGLFALYDNDEYAGSTSPYDDDGC